MIRLTSDSEGPDGQMQQIGSSAAEDSVALENPDCAARAHSNGVAASGLAQPAIAAAMGVSLSTVNPAHMAYEQAGVKALKPSRMVAASTRI
ncbi:MAG: hypothetical protein WCD75_15005 [Rhodoplanes sp.]